MQPNLCIINCSTKDSNNSRRPSQLVKQEQPKTKVMNNEEENSRVFVMLLKGYCLSTSEYYDR